jgi:hypothetical protein
VSRPGNAQALDAYRTDRRDRKPRNVARRKLAQRIENLKSFHIRNKKDCRIIPGRLFRKLLIQAMFESGFDRAKPAFLVVANAREQVICSRH